MRRCVRARGERGARGAARERRAERWASSGGATEIVVLPPVAGASPLLSTEEQEAVSARAAARIVELQGAAGTKMVPWPVEQQRTVAELVAGGRVRPGGPVCARPPDLRTVLDAYLPDVPRLSTQLQCVGATCFLQAVLDVPGPPFQSTWSSSLDTDTPASWDKAAAQLAPSEGPVGHGDVAMLGKPPPVVQAQLFRTSRDFAPHFDQARWRGPERELSACHDKTRTGDVEATPLLTVNEAGEVVRCASRRGPFETPALADCACTALAHATFPPAPPGSGPRRAVVVVSDFGPEPRDTIRTRKGTFAVTIRSHDDDPGSQHMSEVLEPEVRACMIQRGKLEPLVLDVSVEADAAGQVIVVQATSTEPALTGCVETALRHSGIGCSVDRKSHTLHSRLELGTTGPGRPRR